MSKEQPFHASSSDRTPPSQEPLLLVEDDEVSQLYLRTVLTSLGYSVYCAESGEAALDMWRHRRFHAILLDIQLPEIDGIEVARRIRREEREQERMRVPIVALTAYSSSEDRRRIQEAGIERYLSKPTEARALEALLRELGSATDPSGGEEARGAESSSPEEEDTAGEDSASAAGKPMEPGEPGEEEHPDREAYLSRLKEEFADARETLDEMARMSLKEIPERLGLIDRAITERRGEEGAKQAHSLANVAGILFAATLREWCLSLEKELRREDFGDAGERYRQVSRNCTELCEALTSLLEH
jgi:CheY-like chemotaxis protein